MVKLNANFKKSMVVNWKFKCSLISFIFGILFFIFGLTIYFIIPIIIRYKIGKLLPIVNGSFVYQQWKNTTMPTYMQFWFFDILNPNEVLLGSKPNLSQIGPYTYKELRIKQDIIFHNNSESVSYTQKRVFYFDRSKSVGDENDTLTTLNIPYIVIAQKASNLGEFQKMILENSINDMEDYGVFMRTSVKNLTWGYLDPFLETHKEVLKVKPYVGLFYGKNDTAGKIYTVDTGVNSLDNYLKIYSWNGSNKLTMWNDQYANMINGTDGSMYGPSLNKSSRLYVFQSDICRTIYGIYVGSDVVKGIPSLNFAAPDSLFDNHTENPSNLGFCLDGHCLNSGVLNLRKCGSGAAPVVMSQPHFYLAADEYKNSVLGLTPSKEFKTLLKLEPKTGLPLQLQKKLQINIAIESSTFTKMESISPVILPVMWLNESALISDESARRLKKSLMSPVTMGNTVALILMFCGILMATLAVLSQVKTTKYSPVKVKEESNVELVKV